MPSTISLFLDVARHMRSLVAFWMFSVATIVLAHPHGATARAIRLKLAMRSLKRSPAAGAHDISVCALALIRTLKRTAFLHTLLLNKWLFTVLTLSIAIPLSGFIPASRGTESGLLPRKWFIAMLALSAHY